MYNAVASVLWMFGFIFFIRRRENKMLQSHRMGLQNQVNVFWDYSMDVIILCIILCFVFR